MWHLFVIRIKNRKEYQKYLTENNIQSLIHYPIPPHKQSAYKEYHSLLLPLTEKIHNEVLSLPISPVIINKEIETIVSLINSKKY